MIRKILIAASLVLGGLTAVILVFLGVLYFSNSGDYTVFPTTADDPGLPRLVIDGYSFHSESFGNPENRAVIVLHGGPGGDYRSILPLAELSDEYRIVFYDQRGSGLSPRVGEEELTVDQFIADLDAIIENTSPGRQVILIGHSWGAMLASIYIGRYPDKVKKAVLAEPGFLDQEHMEIFNERTGTADLKPTGPVLRAMIGAFGRSLHISGPDEQARKDFFQNSFFTTPMKDNPMAGYYPEGKMENAAGESWRFGALASSSIPASGLDDEGRMMDLAEGVENWKGEALFISGSENKIIGPEYQRSQMERFPPRKPVGNRRGGTHHDRRKTRGIT